MRIVISVLCAALLVILAMGAALWLLAGDFIGAGIFLGATVIIVILLWIITDHPRGI